MSLVYMRLSYVCTDVVERVSGGILRNMSSFIALHEDHRRTLRRTGVYQLLLRQLSSSSLTVVSNACGSLWNLSARCSEDQQRLRDLGAVGLLRSLVNSKHKMIAMGSTAALKNLLVPRSAAAGSKPLNQSASPGLHARRQRSLDRDFERHSDIAEFAGPQRQLFVTGAQHSNGWVMSSSAGGNLFASGGGGRPVVTDPVEEANWRRVIDSAGVKMAHSGAVSGSSSFTHGVERTFHDTQSVDNSPAVHRRVPLSGMSAAVSSCLDYGQPVSTPMGASYNGWTSGMMMSNGPSNAGFDLLSRRTERVHFNDLPDCSQDEPINFSMKYKESTDTGSSPAAQHPSSADTDGRLNSQPAMNSPLTRFHVSRQSLPPARSHQPDFIRTSQVPSYSKPQFTAGAQVRYDAQKFVSEYGRSSIDAEQPTNYSRMYAEHYEDDECSGRVTNEEPIDYSTRYMEPQTCRPGVVFRRHTDEQCTLDADTLQTFCTEGTPMNYQSTATSMTDLSNTRSSKNSEFPSHRRTHSSDDLDVDEVQDFSRKYSEIQTEDENLAGRGSYQWSRQRVDVAAYSPSNDVTNGAGDQPRQYCTEGTPPNFSHSGSLNSLHTDGVVKNQSASATFDVNAAPLANTATSTLNKSTEKYSTVRPTVDDGSLSGKSEGRRAGVMVDMKDTAPGKTVTFDVESNQVEQTPLMFSRSSSLGSLSSFDVRSVHSSVVSEYSVRASQVVSPSELPDSPGNTMPPSPSATAKSSQPPVFFGADVAADKVNDVNSSSVMSGTAETSAVTVEAVVHSDLSSPVHYSSEGGNMSSRTSLSALTCDGERIGLCKEPRCLPLDDIETGTTVSTTAAPDLSRVDDDDDDDVDSPVNEDDERRLTECINLGMPRKRKNRSSKKTSQSGSDVDHLHQQSSLAVSSQLSDSPAAEASASYSKESDPPTAVLDAFNDDSPREFATEDTPLNFSQSGSLTDLSVAGGSETAEPRDTAASETLSTLDSTAPHEDSDASLSDDDDVPGGDELLSYLIEAAMPKKRHHWKPTVNVRGRPAAVSATEGPQRVASRSLEPPTHHRTSRHNPSRLSDGRNHLTASVKQHEMNTKPPPAAAEDNDESASSTHQVHTVSATSVAKPPTYNWATEPSEDHMLSYAVEGTPDSYSRDRSPTSQRIPNALVNRSLSKTGDASWNSSLSSLSFDSSLNAEPTAEESALLQECINAALPKSRAKKSTKKSNSDRQPLRTSPSGSSESSLKRHPVNLTSVQPVDSKTDPDITEESKSQDVSISDWQPDLENGTASCDIMQESLPDVGLMDDESIPSGPSTEANNTVIYVGPSLTDTGLATPTSSSTEPADVTSAAASDVKNSDSDVMLTGVTSCHRINDELTTIDLSPEQVP